MELNFLEEQHPLKIFTSKTTKTTLWTGPKAGVAELQTLTSRTPSKVSQQHLKAIK